MKEKYHIPVLLNECIEALNLKDGGVYVDATLGGGGHTRAILESGKNIRLFSFDQDIAAIAHTADLAQKFPGKLTVITDNFSNLRTRLSLERIKTIDGILFDLGVSSKQIDDAARGFSFSQDGKLDMRMNQEIELTAADIVNEYPAEDLKAIFLEYGEEKEAGKIAKAIVAARQNTRIETTLQLSDIIDNSTYSKQKLKAKARIFQALRIYINGEIEVLKTTLKDAVDILNPGGRIVVISYHSLEDRVVKKFFQYEEKECICPSNFPKCICDKQSTIKILTRKPTLPTKEEIERNSRARSAKLRIAEKKELK